MAYCSRAASSRRLSEFGEAGASSGVKLVHSFIAAGKLTKQIDDIDRALAENERRRAVLKRDHAKIVLPLLM